MPVPALVEAIKANPAAWKTSLEIDDGFPENPNLTYVVFAYQQSLGDSINIAVEDTAAAGVTFTSETVKVSGASAQFKIIDASTLDIQKSGDGRVPIFIRLVVLRMTEKPNGNAKFVTVKTSGILTDLIQDLQSGG